MQLWLFSLLVGLQRSGDTLLKDWVTFSLSKHVESFSGLLAPAQRPHWVKALLRISQECPGPCPCPREETDGHSRQNLQGNQVPSKQGVNENGDVGALLFAFESL